MMIDTSARPAVHISSGNASSREVLGYNERYGDVEFDPGLFGSQVLFLPRGVRMTPFGARIMLREKGLFPLNAAMCDYFLHHQAVFPDGWKSAYSRPKWYNFFVPNLGRRQFAPTILFLGSDLEYGDHSYVRTLRWGVTYDRTGRRCVGPIRDLKFLETIPQLPYAPDTSYIEPHEAIAYMTASQVNQLQLK